jgi:hypothetical protein
VKPLGINKFAPSAVTTWDPVTVSPTITLSNGNRSAVENGVNQFNNARSTVALPVNKKVYVEFTKIGTGQNGGGVPAVGLVDAAAQNNTFLTQSGPGFLTYGTFTSNGSGGDYTGGPDWSAAGSVVGLAIDTTARLMWFRPVSTPNWNNNPAANPATGVGGLPYNAGVTYKLGCDPFSTGQGFTINCGQAAFSGAIPSGFVAWG